MNKILITRTVWTVLAFAICGLSISLYLLSGLGSDPVTLFQDGLSNALSLSIGIASLIFHLSVIILAFFIDRKFLGIATVVSLLIVGPSIDVFMPIFSQLFTPESTMAIRLVVYFAAFFGLSLGVSIYLAMNTGVSASDMTPVIMSAKTKFQFRWCKVAFDIILVVAGIYLGGVFGWGTIFAALGTGPTIQFLRNKIEKRLQ